MAVIGNNYVEKIEAASAHWHEYTTTQLHLRLSVKLLAAFVVHRST